MKVHDLPPDFADGLLLSAALGRDAPAPVRPGPDGTARVELAEGDAARLAFCLETLGFSAAQVAGATRWRAGGGEAGAPLSLPDGDRELLAEVISEIAGLHPRIRPEAARRLAASVPPRALARLRGVRQSVNPGCRTVPGPGDLEPIALERPWMGYFAVETHRLRHRRFDGAMSPVIERTVFASGDAVTVLPYDPVRDRVLLVEQFRPGPFARRDPQPWCLEVVAGRCDAGETLDDAARREAREEAGIGLGRLEPVLGYYTSPGTTAEHLTAFVGEADLAGAGGIHGLADEDEDIRVLVLDRAEALAAIGSGDANNAPLLVSLLWLAANGDDLRRRWSDRTPDAAPG